MQQDETVIVIIVVVSLQQDETVLVIIVVVVVIVFLVVLVTVGRTVLPTDRYRACKQQAVASRTGIAATTFIPDRTRAFFATAPQTQIWPLSTGSTEFFLQPARRTQTTRPLRKCPSNWRPVLFANAFP